MEKKSADVKQGLFSKRNLIPRLILRTVYMLLCGFFAAMLPFFADINAVVGAIGFIPLDFILPMLLYNMTCKPSRSSYTYWINNIIMIVFTCVGLLGAFSSIRSLIRNASTFKPFSSGYWCHIWASPMDVGTNPRAWFSFPIQQEFEFDGDKGRLTPSENSNCLLYVGWHFFVLCRDFIFYLPKYIIFYSYDHHT